MKQYDIELSFRALKPKMLIVEVKGYEENKYTYTVPE